MDAEELTMNVLCMQAGQAKEARRLRDAKKGTVQLVAVVAGG